MTAGEQGIANAQSDPAKAGQPEDMPIDDALYFAKRALQAGDFQTAGVLYYRILEADPNTAEALHYAGLLQHQRGEAEEAVELIRQSLALEPDHADWRSNLGSVLIEQGRHDEAVEAFRAVVLREPDHTQAHNNLGVALRLLNRPAEAEASYRKAIAIDPKCQEAYDNLGRLMVSLGRIRDGIWAHAKARELEPFNERTRRHLVAAYGASGDTGEALKILDEWLADDPDNTIALHMRASLTGENVPERASDTYVQALFDGFAASFDAQLARLGYRAPELAVAALAAACGLPRGDLAICDAGCGTGLCGPLLKPFASHLTGIDLSERMLDKARPRGCYDALVKAELTQFLLDHRGAFDAIVSADTLCYFGAVEAALAAAADALRPGGLLVFSVESADEVQTFRLNHHGRYSHNPAYVEQTLQASGLQVLGMRSDVLRREVGEPVMGMLVTARKPA